MTIGASPYKIDARGKVTGTAVYPGDIQRDNFLHAKAVFSGQPHARMISMDTRTAASSPGVIAIFTAKDIPLNEYGLTMFDQPVLVGVDGNGRSAIPADVSRWEADMIALIVAETAAAADTAAALLSVQWQPLPIVTDIDTALHTDTLVHPENGIDSNIFYDYRIRKGEMAVGWAAADVIIEGSYEVPYQEHAYLQPEAAVSYIDKDGRATVEIAGQWTHEDQEQIAHALDLPIEKVRVIYPAIGGAFGGREDMTLQIVMALAALRLHETGEHRPIRTQWSREESIVGHHKRHRATIHTKWGATKDGTIVAVEADCYLDAGAYNYTSNKVLGNLHLTVTGPYELPNALINSYAVYTNTVPGGAFRGFGAPQGCFVAESQMNKVAAALNIDPVAIRLKNCLREGSIGITQTPIPAGVSLPEVIKACGERASQPVNQSASQQQIAFQSLADDKSAMRYGRGFACAYKNIGFSFGFPERSEATIELYGDGEIERVICRQAGADVGQGAHTAFQQMAAAAVGVPFAKAQMIVSDTAETGDSGSASASRLTYMAGNAIKGAAERALQAWADEERPAVGHYRYVPPATTTLDPQTGVGDPNFAYGYVAEAADIAVDIETGHIQVLRVICATDVGKAINPNLIEGQIEGAVIQAHGYTLTENLQVVNGKIANPRFSGYLIPGIMDIPLQVESIILEYPDPNGPWGVRGMAEMPLIPLAPAIIAALHDATGVWFDQFPLTPGRVAMGLKAAAH